MLSIRQFLVTNDDGVNAQGIKVLTNVLSQFGQVTVVAPDRERSGHGHSITTKTPLRAAKLSHNDTVTVYSVDGTPVDCLKWGLETLFADKQPDLVLSGINHGANVGQDVFYSGTIGAAREAILYGLPAIALSAARDADERIHYDWVAEILGRYIQPLLEISLPRQTLLNVNIPGTQPVDVKGIQVVEMDVEAKRFDIIKDSDPRGSDIYWMKSLFNVEGKAQSQDLQAVKEGFVTVSPVSVGSANVEVLNNIEKQMEALS